MLVHIFFSLAACLTYVWAADNIYINTYIGPDGRSYFTQPLYCNYSGSLLLSTYYNQLRSTYTVRDDRNCCYLSDSRNQCCVQCK
ncbi:cell wall protein DAN4 [Biomphalaria pfeifferi]|uniref:Cell wall protein DAN4 n=1 Tax=Biomphalaria pfeifferi TaxID=112525 RepID=A0AAD8C6L6_BIOPF|nr:cell wall protein DAN4 [Biomphalaria pfeifferi]